MQIENKFIQKKKLFCFNKHSFTCKLSYPRYISIMIEINDIIFEENSPKRFSDEKLLNNIISPINISITDASPIHCKLLNWINYDALPEKLELINTGQTSLTSYYTHIPIKSKINILSFL